MEEKNKNKENDEVLKELLEAPVSKNEISNLKKFTDNDEFKLAAGDLVSHVVSYEKESNKEGYYHDIIFALVQIRLPEEDAKNDWEEILKHKYTVSETLGRNIGIHVAALDYYTNIKKYIANPKIVEADEYVDTASHAMIDDLTQAYNRRYFESEIKRLFKYSKTVDSPFSIIMTDIDHFKKYNDSNGHLKGDIALIETVKIFHAVVGNTEAASVCRYGGEEFAILVPEKNIHEAYNIAENIRLAVYDYGYTNEVVLPNGKLTVSFGVAEFNHNLDNYKELINMADIALYQAKENGRNRVVKYSEQNG